MYCARIHHRNFNMAAMQKVICTPFLHVKYVWIIATFTSNKCIQVTLSTTAYFISRHFYRHLASIHCACYHIKTMFTLYFNELSIFSFNCFLFYASKFLMTAFFQLSVTQVTGDVLLCVDDRRRCSIVFFFLKNNLALGQSPRRQEIVNLMTPARLGLILGYNFWGNDLKKIIHLSRDQLQKE